jgi:hypothetical protein
MSCLVSDITIKYDIINAEINLSTERINDVDVDLLFQTKPNVDVELVIQPIKVVETQVRGKNLWDITCGIICSLRDFVKSAFTKGYWMNDKPWMDDQTWSNKP